MGPPEIACRGYVVTLQITPKSGGTAPHDRDSNDDQSDEQAAKAVLARLLTRRNDICVPQDTNRPERRQFHLNLLSPGLARSLRGMAAAHTAPRPLRVYRATLCEKRQPIAHYRLGP